MKLPMTSRSKAATCKGVYQQMVDEGICTQEEMDEMLAIVAAAK